MIAPLVEIFVPRQSPEQEPWDALQARADAAPPRETLLALVEEAFDAVGGSLEMTAS